MAREKFTIRLSDAEKTEYQEHMREHTSHESLSAWFRALADDAIYNHKQEDGPVVDEAAIRNAIATETSDLKLELSRVTEKIADLDEAVRTGDETTHYAEEVYRIFSGSMPEDVEIYDREADGYTSNDIPMEQYVASKGTAEIFSNYFGIPVEDARRALVRCENMFPAIKSDFNEETGIRRWYREGETKW